MNALQAFTRASAAIAVMALLAPNSKAQVFTANLDGPSEAPANASPGTGFATVTFNAFAHTMRVQVSFSGLSGLVTASHIHASTAVPGVGTAGVATQTPTFVGFPLGGTSGTYDVTFDMTQASSYRAGFITANGGTPSTAEVALFDGIQTGRAYLNIHTDAFPGGEIRGFLAAAAPEPGTLALLGLGGVALVVRRRTRR